MKYRSVVMYIEIGCFVACVCGWILVCATLPIQYWTYSEVATSVLTNSHTFSNLWKDCMTDLTGMVDCKVFPSLLSLQMYIHLCRATIFTSIVLGFLGAILALIGMKCTKLGGSEITNSKITLAAGMIYLASGLCAMFAFSWYGNKIITEFMDPTHRTKKFELGVALFVGWGGSSLLIIGGLVYSIFGGREGCEARYNLVEHSVLLQGEGSSGGQLLSKRWSSYYDAQKKSLNRLLKHYALPQYVFVIKP
uniref:Claudin n=1 Tax=Astyanax mexicanus TaxID=7994 RepID=A0A3B1JVH5_ASTMX